MGKKNCTKRYPKQKFKCFPFKGFNFFLLKTILKERGVETLPRQLPRISNLQKDLVWWEKRLWEANSTLNYIQVHSPRHFLTNFTKRFGVMIECYKTQIQQKFEIHLSTKEIPPSNQSKPYLAPKNLALAIPSSNNTNHLIRLLLCPSHTDKQSWTSELLAPIIIS